MFVMARGEKKPHGGICPSHQKLSFPVKWPKQDLAVATDFMGDFIKLISPNTFSATISSLERV